MIRMRASPPMSETRMDRVSRRAIEVRAHLCLQEKPVTYAAVRIAELEEQVKHLKEKLEKVERADLPMRRIM